jgi:Predicted membrane protein (DUF2254)
MVALLGFVVTSGVLVIQQATATLSPRFMRLWYRDRLQKVVLATFAGTFTYSFALLRRVDTNSVPDLGVTIAGIAVAVSLILLLVYLNLFTHALRPVAVAAMVEMALTPSRFADGCDRCSTACLSWPRPIVAKLFTPNFRCWTTASREASPTRLTRRSREQATLRASAHRPWSGRTRTVGDASKWPTPVQGRAD